MPEGGTRTRRKPDFSESFACFPPAPLSRGFLYFRKDHGGLETVAAGVTRPTVPDAALVEMFRPIRSEQPSAALRADILIMRDQA